MSASPRTILANVELKISNVASILFDEINPKKCHMDRVVWFGFWKPIREAFNWNQFGRLGNLIDEVGSS